MESIDYYESGIEMHYEAGEVTSLPWADDQIIYAIASGILKEAPETTARPQ